MATDNTAMRNLISATTSQKRADLIGKIDKALKNKQEAEMQPAKTVEYIGATSPLKTPEAAIFDSRKQRAKKEKQINDILGEDSVYANTVTRTKAEPVEYLGENKTQSGSGLKGVWNGFVNKRLSKIKEKTDKKLDKIDKDIATLEGQKHTRDKYEDKAQQDYMVPDDFDLYVPNTYTGAGTMDFRDIDDPIFGSLGGSAQNVMGPEGNTEFKNKRNFYDDYLELEKYANEDDEAIRFAVKDKVIAEKHPLLEQEDLIHDAAVIATKEAAKKGIDTDLGSSLVWNGLFEKAADELGVTFPHRTYQQAMDTVDGEYRRLIREEKNNRVQLLKAFEAFGREMGRQQMPTKYQDNQGTWYGNPEYKYGTTNFRDIGNYDLEEWDEWLNLLNEDLDRYIDKKQSKKEKVQDKANKKFNFWDDLYL